MIRKGAAGKVIVISSPSGGGKTTICNELRRRNREWKFSISYTTREKRAGEKNGREYYFVDKDEFLHLRKKKFFAESAKVHLYYYGTPRRPLESALKEGKVILLDVDVQGAASIRRIYGDKALFIFILPPSKAELRRRLKRRGTETKEQVKVRLNNAISEMNKYNRFDYVIVNKDINEAVNSADHIIKSWTVGVTYFGRRQRTEQIRPLVG